MSEHIIVESSDRVRWIRLHRAEKKNAITWEMYDAFTDALEAASAEPSVRVLCIAGDGGNFTSGSDVKAFLDPPPLAGKRPPHRFLEALVGFEKPIVAAVDGFAIGIGATMLLHADLVYAAAGATFRFPFVALGLVPEAASSLTLPLLAGHQRAAELLLLAEKFDARTALAIGLVNEIVAEEALREHVRAKARALAELPPAAVRATKALMKRARPTIAEQMSREFELFEERLRSGEVAEAISAFLERRAADFSRFE